MFKCYVKTAFFSKIYKLNAIQTLYDLVPNITACSVGISCILCDVTSHGNPPQAPEIILVKLFYLISPNRLITKQNTSRYLIPLSNGAVFATCN